MALGLPNIGVRLGSVVQKVKDAAADGAAKASSPPPPGETKRSVRSIAATQATTGTTELRARTAADSAAHGERPPRKTSSSNRTVAQDKAEDTPAQQLDVARTAGRKAEKLASSTSSNDHAAARVEAQRALDLAERVRERTSAGRQHGHSGLIIRGGHGAHLGVAGTAWMHRNTTSVVERQAEQVIEDVERLLTRLAHQQDARVASNRH